MVNGYSTPKLSKVYPYKSKKRDQLGMFFEIRKKPLGKMERFLSAIAKILVRILVNMPNLQLQSPEY